MVPIYFWYWNSSDGFKYHVSTYDDEWDNYDYIQLTMTMAEYTYHKLVVHGGQTTQNDGWDVCDSSNGSVLIVDGGIPDSE